MNGETFEATVINGQIRLPTDVHLPENSRVLVVVPNETHASPGHLRSPQLVHPEQAADFKMEVREIADAGPSLTWEER